MRNQICIILILIFPVFLFSQNVGIGSNTPDPSAKLDISSTTSGLLPPRMTQAERNAITSPALGLMVYCIDCGGGEIEVYSGIDWRNMIGGIAAKILSIGDSYGGGKVAYILQSNDTGYIVGQVHGLIAAASDQGNPPWGCIGVAIPGADGIDLGTGNQNTIDIIAGCSTSGIAARICNDLILEGYNDWYLPSKEELTILYMNRVAIGGFGGGFYWSSSEYDDQYAWVRYFTNGDFAISIKSTDNNVRAIRSF